MGKDYLNAVSISSPCSVDWDSMDGDDRVRFCWMCEQSVYNVENLTRAEANKLLGGRSGRVCLRMFKRADGTIMTKDCPVGLRRIKQSLQTVRKRICAAVALSLAIVALKPGSQQADSRVGSDDRVTVRRNLCYEGGKDAIIDPLAIARRNTEAIRSKEGASNTGLSESHDAISIASQAHAHTGRAPRLEGGPSSAEACETVSRSDTPGTALVPAGSQYVMGTAATVRVDNLANVENVLSFLGNAIEIMGLTAGACVLSGVLRCRSGRNIWKTVAVSVLLVVCGLCAPAAMDWLVTLVREANLFA